MNFLKWRRRARALDAFARPLQGNSHKGQKHRARETTVDDDPLLVCHRGCSMSSLQALLGALHLAAVQVMPGTRCRRALNGSMPSRPSLSRCMAPVSACQELDGALS